MSKMFIGAVVLVAAFVAIAWFGWFGPMSKSFKGVKNNAVNVKR